MKQDNRPTKQTPAAGTSGARQTRKGIVVTVVAAVVIAATLLTVAIVFTVNGNKRPTPDSVPTEYSYEVFSADPASATAVTVKEGDMTLSLSFADGEWTLSDDREMPIDKTSVADRIARLVSLKSSVRYTKTEESQRTEFGLNPPSLSVTVTDAAYGTRTLYLGRFSAAAGGYYASTSDAADTVYVVGEEAYRAFSGIKPSDLLRIDSFPVVTAATLDGFDLTADGNTYKFSFDIRGIEKDGKTYYWFVCVNGAASVPVDTDADTLCTPIVSLRFDKLLSFRSSDLAGFGITDGSPTLTVRFTETVTVPSEDGNRYEQRSYSATLRFGRTENGNTDCVNPSGTSTVYSLSENLLDDLLAVARRCS